MARDQLGRNGQMYGIMWTLNRAAAALVGTLAVTACAAAIWTLFYALTCGADCGPSPFDYLPWMFVVSGILGGPVAAVAGFTALTITPASKAPWRALPILILASVIGIALGVALLYCLPTSWRSADVWVVYAFPCVLGFTAAASIGRLPPLLRV